MIDFGLPLDAPGVKVLDTWRALGMRGTGSHDIELESVFLPDAVMGGVRRPPGKWHPAVHASALVALPIIYAAYLGVAEAARDVALELARKRKNDPNVAYLTGEMENLLVSAQLAHAAWSTCRGRRSRAPRRRAPCSSAEHWWRTASSGPPRRRWKSRGARASSAARGSNACFGTSRPAATTRCRRSNRRG